MYFRSRRFIGVLNEMFIKSYQGKLDKGGPAKSWEGGGRAMKTCGCM